MSKTLTAEEIENELSEMFINDYSRLIRVKHLMDCYAVLKHKAKVESKDEIIEGFIKLIEHNFGNATNTHLRLNTYLVEVKRKLLKQ